MRVICFGELLWDIIGGKEFLGGAPFNFAVASARLGAEVRLISAVGDDARGTRTLAAVRAHGLDARSIAVVPDRATGTAAVASGADGEAAFTLNRPCAYDFLRPTPDPDPAWAPDWIYFGTLAQTSARNRASLNQLLEATPGARRFYDLNLRDGHWTLALVEELSAHASTLKLNGSEAETLWRLARPDATFSLEGFAALWSHMYGIDTICITLGGAGCAVWRKEEWRRFPGFAIKVADTVGAGDAFSAAFLHGIGEDWPVERTAAFANALGAIVASRPGATPEWRRAECEALAQSASVAGRS